MSAERGRYAVVLAALLLAGCSGGTEEPDKFAQVPQSCDLVSAETVLALTGSQVTGASGIGESDRSSSCSWTYEPDKPPKVTGPERVPYRRSLKVSVFLHRPPGDISGVEIARDVFQAQRERLGELGKTSVDQLGDEAYMRFSSDRQTIVEFRRSNLTVEVDYQGTALTSAGGAGLGDQQTREGALRVAREVDQKLAR